MYCKPSCLVAIAAGFVSSVVAQSFSQPDLSASSGEIVQYTVGQQVEVAWTSPWEYTKVGVHQIDPSTYYQIANASSTTTSIVWVAQNFDNADLSTQTFFFRLSDGTLPDQTSPYYDSGDFALTNAVAAASTTSGAASSTTSSASATSTSASTTSSVSSSSAAAATSAAASSDAGNVPAVGSTTTTENLNYTSSYLGVGLGLGIPFLLAITAAAVLFIRNKRKAGQAGSGGPGDVSGAGVVDATGASAVLYAEKGHGAQNRDSLPIGPLPFEETAERDRSILRSITREEPNLTALPSRSAV